MSRFKKFYIDNSPLFMVEAFSLSQNNQKTLDTVKKKIEDMLKVKLYQEYGINYFSNEKGSGKGIRYFIGNTDGAVRFNFTGEEVGSIDIWRPKGDSSTPDVNVEVDHANLEKLVPTIVGLIRNPIANDVEVDLNEGYVVEAEKANARKDSLIKSMGLEYIGWRKYADKKGGHFTWDDKKNNFTKIEVKQTVPVKTAAATPQPAQPQDGKVKIGDKFYKNASSAIEDLLSQGKNRAEIATLTGSSDANIYRIARKLGVVHTLKVQKGTSETSGNEDPTIKRGQKLLPQYADPETVYEDLDDLVNMVSKNLQSSLIVSGMAGIGKTYSVTKQIEKNKLVLDKDWFHVKGKATAAALYRELFAAKNGKLIVFDDCDSVFKDDDAVNILKAALDSYDKRTISWKSTRTFDIRKVPENSEEYWHLIDEGKYPDRFDFTGRVIFISNLPQSKLDSAIKSRSFTIDITLKAEDVLLRIKSVMDKLMPNTTDAIRKDAFKYLQKTVKEGKKEEGVNIRTFLNACKMRMSGSPNWERLCERYA